MAVVLIDGMAKRKKDQDNDNDSLSSYNNTKKTRRVVWSDDLHAKFVEAVNLLGLHGTFVGTASSKSTSIWDYDWYHKYMKKEPQLLQLPNSSFPVLESDKTSQMNNSQQTHNVVEPFIVGSASSLAEKNTNIWCDDNSFIDFPVEETDPKPLENIANMSRCIEEEDLINVWRSFQEEDVTNVMQQPSCC
ncbi:hypothetical protein RYX36_022460 [Vicia faba]